MKSGSRDTIIVGLVVFFAFIIVIWSLFYLQGYFGRQNMTLYYARFDQVGMLLEGNPVQVAGVPVGRVESIELEGRRALVKFNVDKSVVILEGSVAQIETIDMFGDAVMHLKINEGRPLPAGSEVRGELVPGISDLVKEGVRVVQRTIAVLEDAHTLITRFDTLLGPGSTFSRTLDNVEEFTANGREISHRFEEYGRLLEETMAALDSAATGFNSVVQDNAQNVKRMVERLDTLSVRLDAMVADLESGRGTLGRMLKDESLYEELRETALEARNLMREIRDNPEKFINIKAF